MGKKGKEAFEKKIKKDVKKSEKKLHETDEEYLRRIMGDKAVKKPLKPVDSIYFKNDNDKIITHEDQERY